MQIRTITSYHLLIYSYAKFPLVLTSNTKNSALIQTTAPKINNVYITIKTNYPPPITIQISPYISNKIQTKMFHTVKMLKKEFSTYKICFNPHLDTNIKRYDLRSAWRYRSFWYL